MQLILPEEVLSLAFSQEDPISSTFVRSARIQIAQLRYIRPAFGNAMYQKMREGAEDYTEFVTDYIKPALAHYVRYEMTGELAVRAGEYGIVRPSSEQSVQTSSETKNDQQSSRDELEQDIFHTDDVEKKVSDTNTQKHTNISTTEKVNDEFVYNENTKTNSIGENNSGLDMSVVINFEQEDAASSSAVTEIETTADTKIIKNRTENAADSHEGGTNTTYYDSVDGLQTQSGTDTSAVTESSESVDTTLKSATGTSKLKSENFGVGNTNRTSFKAATTDEWQTFARQSLRDANVFLRYAIEYVEANSELFPDYAPMSVLGSSFLGRRCIGGIVL